MKVYWEGGFRAALYKFQYYELFNYMLHSRCGRQCEQINDFSTIERPCMLKHVPRRNVSSAMFDGLLRQQLLDLFIGDLQELKGRLDNAVEQEGKVHKQGEPDDL
jgi:hypothetical protein